LKRVRDIVRRFLKAEEVPRWFGLSLVLIYIVGLGTVARLGISIARRDAAAYFQQSSAYAVRLLSEHLSVIGSDGFEPQELATEVRRALRDFGAAVPARLVRVVENGRIIASTMPNETGAETSASVVSALNPGELDTQIVSSSGDIPQERVLRVVLRPPARESASLAPPDGTVRYVEAALPMEALAVANLANQAGTLAVILVVLGALFLVYRCLREQMRSVWRIADRLESNRSNIEQGLASLRIGDTLDTVTAGWNELVDLTQRLLESVQRAEANEELSRALQKSSGGAVAEALHAVPDGIVFITDEVRFEYANAAALRLLGWSAKDAKEKTLRDAASSGVGGAILELIRGSLQVDGRFEGRTDVVDSKDDQSCYRVSVIPLQRGRRDGQCIVLIRDVSQQLRAERAREDFVAQVTHELRTPLTNIRAYAETLSSGMFEDPKVITECYNVITKETRRLSRLIEDILSVSQLEVGSIELRIDQVDLRTVLSEGLRDVRGLADEKNIDVQLVLPAKLEPIRGDRDKLAVVINNLLGNAIKYTPANGNVIVGCQPTSEAVVLTFKDNGIGIDAKDQARVFEKFQRGSDPQVQQETGTGIGLYTAREIVRRHGGDIELISEKAKGSTFMVRLPRAESRAASLRAPEGAKGG